MRSQGKEKFLYSRTTDKKKKKILKWLRLLNFSTSSSLWQCEHVTKWCHSQNSRFLSLRLVAVCEHTPTPCNWSNKVVELRSYSVFGCGIEDWLNRRAMWLLQGKLMKERHFGRVGQWLFYSLSHILHSLAWALVFVSTHWPPGWKHWVFVFCCPSVRWLIYLLGCFQNSLVNTAATCQCSLLIIHEMDELLL